MEKSDFKKISDWLWEIPKSFRPDMRVPARVYVSEKMLEEVEPDAIGQVINVASLPGIIKYSLAMPDLHTGYGFVIGGVAAMDMKDGVISPGGVGYDINCLHPNSKINLSFGINLSISELEKYWKSLNVILVDKTDKNLKNVSVVNFLSREEDKFLYKIKTKSGFEIKATADHPFYNGAEMKNAEKLKIGEKLVVFPFLGVNYQEAADEELINKEKIYEAFKKLKVPNKGNRYSQIIKWFQERDLINLKYNSWQTPYLIKILGYLFGDGTVNFVGKDRGGLVSFYGKLDDLKEIQNDLNKVGIKTFIYSRKRNHKINTFYKKYQFTYTEHSLNSRSSSFTLLLYLLGAPLGNKTNQKFCIPEWLWKAPLWQKRLFLASFFGAELSKPATLNKYNFYSPTLNINKILPFKNNGITFLNELRKILTEFGVRSSEVMEVEELSKSGKTIGLRFQIFNNTENLLKFFQSIGFEYNLEKQKLACLAIGFLKQKKEILTLRTKIRNLARNLYSQGVPAQKIVSDYKTEFLGKRFIEHSIWSHRGEPRIAFDFPSFEEYIKTHQFGDYGLMTDEIEEIKKENYKGLVYDFTVNHKDHNFIAENFVVSNCGMKLLKSEYKEEDIKPYLDKLATEIQKEVPSGLGRGRQLKLDVASINKILESGAQRLVEQGYGEKEDLENCESQGRLPQADTSTVSDHAKNRGRDQVGTLGSGNHFLEIQKVDEIFNEEAASTFGLFKDQIVIMIHTGSRGLGHQIATDYIKVMMRAMTKYDIRLPDRELAACPINSSEGKRYFSAMACGANYAWANRQMITHFVRKAWKTVLGEKTSPLVALYDVAHNIAKIEKHNLGRKEVEVVVHRKGATRAFPPEHPEIPKKYREVGQPVLIPGSMGTASYVLVGIKEGEEAWFSTCHGAGRTMSRHGAMRRVSGQEVVKNLESRGIIVKCWSLRGIAEEAPIAYKDVDNVVEVVHNAGLSRKVARLRPLAVIKGE
jgi:tRNA-splicing ligase RtcB